MNNNKSVKIRRRIFIMAFICICSTPAISQNIYVVTGAPATEFNGTYVEYGTENGKPSYRMGDSSYVVSGATEIEFNGLYKIAGTENGKPYYLMGSTYKIFFNDFGGAGEWDISKASGNLMLSWHRQYMVVQDSPTATPPQTGWTDGFGVSVASLIVVEYPSVIANAPTGVHSTSATFNGTVTSGSAATYHFNYGTDPASLSNSTAETSVAVGTSVAVSAAVTGLTTQTLYYYALVATITGGGTSTSGTASIFVQGSVPTANLKMWLRADQLVTASGSAVSAWGDISGNANNASQSTAAYQPSSVSSAINSKPVVRFNGTNSYLALPTASALGLNGSPYQIFIVAKSALNDIQFLISGSSYQYEFHLSNTTSARFIPISGSSNYFLDQTTAVCNGSPHLFSMQTSASLAAIRIDGVTGGSYSGDLRSSNTGAIRLGRRSDDGYALNGDIAEVLIYNTVLTTTARDSVERYIAQRYAITSGALPVELLSFTAEIAAKGVELKWNTATEINNYGFEIQRSAVSSQQSANTWSKIGFVEGNGTTNAPKSYSYTDKSANGKTSYRLKQIDRDGKFEYSQTVEVTVASAPKEFALEQNYPNPFNPTTIISYQIPVSNHVSLKVFDMLGKEVATLVNETKETGSYSAKVDGTKLSSGIYFYKLQSGNLIAVKKLTIMK